MSSLTEIAAAVVAVIAIAAVIYHTGVIRGKMCEMCRRVEALEKHRKDDMQSVYKKLQELSVQMARVEAKLES